MMPTRPTSRHALSVAAGLVFGKGLCYQLAEHQATHWPDGRAKLERATPVGDGRPSVPA